MAQPGAAVAAHAPVPKKTFMDSLLDGIETLGNKVPNPVMMFVYLIALVLVLSTVLALFGVSVTEEVLAPVPYTVSRDFYEDTTQVQTVAPAVGVGYGKVHFQPQQETTAVRGLLTIEGIRFLFTSGVDLLSHHPGRRPVQRRRGRRVPDPDSARRRQVRQPQAQPHRWSCGGLRRCRRDLRIELALRRLFKAQAEWDQSLTTSHFRSRLGLRLTLEQRGS
jgi:putative AbgT family transporter